MLAACGVPQSDRGGGLSSADRLTAATEQGLCFRKDLARGRNGVFVGCYVGMWAGTGRCYHRTQCEGFLCQLLHYPPIGHEPVVCTHMHAHFRSRL